MLTKDTKRKLSKLAQFLDKKVPSKNFSLDVWCCGSAACAVGWAWNIPEFKKEGFTSGSLSYPCPRYRGKVDWGAVKDFFGLSWDQALFLFHRDSYEHPNKTNVIKRIREFVKEN